MNRQRRGFTMIEVSVAIALLAAAATLERTATWRAVLPDGHERSADSVSQSGRLQSSAGGRIG